MPHRISLTMTELDRLQVLTQLAARQITRQRAVTLLTLSARQVRRLGARLAASGAAGLASRHRGRASNRRLAVATRDQALALVRERYPDFGPHVRAPETH